MRSLAEVNLALSYESSGRDLISTFYEPCLSRSVRYDRAVGYFRSSVYAVTGIAVSSFARSGGQMRLVCSPQMSSEDVRAIARGADLHATADAAILSELQRLLDEPLNRPVIELLATLVALGRLDIRIAVPTTGRGIYHDKLGIFTDARGDAVSFRGSANETWSAWNVEANFESFEAFRASDGGRDAERVTAHQQTFERLWLGRVPRLQVRAFEGIPLQELLNHASDDLDTALAAAHRVIGLSRRPPVEASLQEHQAAVITNWFGRACRGIVDHVTGAGKTVTAMEVIRRWMAERGPAIVFVPSRLLALQWQQEAVHWLGEGEVALLAAGGGSTQWQRDLADFTDPSSDFGPRLTIATLQTASTDAFVRRVRSGDHLLVVADEVHRVGSPTFRRITKIDAGGRLGLSATPERFGDREGTDVIFDYFGEPLPPPFTLADGIAAGRLVPYDYHIRLVEMTDDEWEEWERLSDDIAREAAMSRGDESAVRRLSDRLRFLLIQRARIKKQAVNKVGLARRVLRDEFEEGDRWLVYCDSQHQLREVMDALTEEGLSSSEYHSGMIGDRDETLAYFKRRGGVVVAIRCLDEGVDIPSVDRALILASSINRREFIQRRGRVLRASPETEKSHAVIYDALVTSPGGIQSEAVLPIELERAAQFAEFARNSAVRLELSRLAAIADVSAPDVEDDEEDER